MSNEIFFDGVRFISASDAAASASITRDYVARLCRDGKVMGKRVGTHWYVKEASLKDFLLKQVHSKEIRRESLSETRVREYQEARGIRPKAPQRVIEEVREPIPVKEAREIAPARDHAAGLRENFHSTLMAQGERLSRVAPAMMVSPTGLQEVVLRGAAHVPTHAVAPIVEVVHKFIALSIAFSLTFGTYALVDPDYARFAVHTAREGAQSIASAIGHVAYDAVPSLAEKTREGALFAAEHPGSALEQASSAALAFIPDTLARIARVWNTEVDEFIYAIAFPRSVTDSVAIVSRVNTIPLRENVESGAGTSAQSASTTAPSVATLSGAPAERIIERVQIERIVSTAGGISEEYLNQRLASLQGSMVSAPSTANSTAVTSIYNMIAGTNNIDQLESVAIRNSTITGGTITGATISGGSVTATAFDGVLPVGNGGTGTSTTPTYGKVLLGNTAGGYDIVATSSLGITGAVSSTTQFSIFERAYFGGTATSTFDSAGNLAVAGTISGGTSTVTNLIATNSSTSTFAGGVSVAGNLNFNGTLLQNNLPFTSSQWTTSGSNIYYSSGNVGLGTTSPFAKFAVHANSGETNKRLFEIASSTASATTTHFVVTNVGRVGIGTASPSTQLEIGDGTTVSSQVLQINASSASGYGPRINFSRGGTLQNWMGTDSEISGGNSDDFDFAARNNNFRFISGSTGSTEYMRLTNSGNLGIGTTSPWAKLAISGNSGDTNTNLFLVSSSTASATSTHFVVTNSGNVGIGTTTPGGVFAVENIGSGHSIFVADQADDSTPFVVNASGNVGIGTASPSVKLQVSGVNGTVRFVGTDTTSAVYGRVVNSDSSAGLYYGVEASAGGNVFIGGSSYASVLGNQTATPLQFATNFTVRATIDSSGNFGIGTSSPTNKLEVQGGAFIGGNLIATGTIAVTSNGSNTFPYASSTAFTAAMGYFSTASTTNLVLSGSPSGVLVTDSSGTVSASSSLSAVSGGTGNTSYAVGDILYASAAGTLGRLNIGSTGQVLKVSGGLPTWGADATGGGGSGAFSTSSDSLIVYPTDTSDVILFGAAATTTTGNIFETYGNSLFRGLVTAYNTVTAPTFTATSTTAASTFPYASSTALTATNGFFSTASTTSFTLSGTRHAILGTDGSGTVSATTSIGSGYITGTLGTVNGTTFARGDSITITAASSTLLADSNVWSALQRLTSASSSQLSVFTKAYFGGSATTTIDSAGNLAVAGTASVSGGDLTLNKAAGAALRIADGAFTAAVGYLDNSGLLQVKNFDAISFNTGDPTAVERFRITGSGNFGIGTTTPFGKFALSLKSGETYTGNNAFIVSSSTASATTTLFRVSNAGDTLTSGTASSTSVNVSGNGSYKQGENTILTTGTGGVALGGGASFGIESLCGSACRNIGLGTFAMNSLSSGAHNTAVGAYAGMNSSDGGLTIGNQNTFLGFNSGANVTTGSNNIVIGYTSKVASPTGSNQLSIGNLIFGTLPSRGLNTTFTDTTLELPTSGTIGIGTTSPTARFGIALNSGGTLAKAFEISSSTTSATTTLFSIANTGAISASGAITSTATGANTLPYASSTETSVSGTGYFGTASTSNLTISSLISTRIPFATTAGSLTSSSALTFNSTAGRLTTTYASTTALSASGSANIGGQLIMADGDFSAPAIIFGNGNSSGIFRGSDDRVEIVAEGTTALQVYGSKVLFPYGSISAPGIGFASEPGTGLYRPATGQLALVTNGSAEALRAVGTRVGIGTTTPYYLLTLASSTGAQLALSDGSASSNAWIFRSIANNLYFATSTYSASSTVAALAFDGVTGAATFGSPATSTFEGNLNVKGQLKVGTGSIYLNGSATSTFSAGIQTTALNVTSTTATSTFANGIQLTAGCFMLPSGSCAGTGSGSSGGGGNTLIGTFATGTPGSNVQVVFSGTAGSSPSFSGGTLTLPSDTSYIEVEVWGGGGGGGGSGTGAGGAGGTGGQSCFGTNATACTSPMLNATGGEGGGFASHGGAGGSGSGGDVNLTGSGGQGVLQIDAVAGGAGHYFSSMGGSAPRGGGGARGRYDSAETGAAFGGGGGGGGVQAAVANNDTGGGGGGGGYSYELVTSPSGSYYYTIGTGGTAGSAGTSGKVGAAGGAGGFSVKVYTNRTVGSTSSTTPSFFVHRNGSATSTVAGSHLVMDWTTETFDTNNNFDLTTDRFTPTVAGKYFLNGSLACSDGTSYCIVTIWKNGTQIASGYILESISDAATAHVTTIVDMNGSTDYVDMRVYNSNGTGIVGSHIYTRFTGSLLGGGAGSPSGSTGTLQFNYGGAFSASSTLVYDTTNARLGIGSSTPGAKLSVHANSGETNLKLFEIASSTASATSSFLTVLNTGNVGIGTTSPNQLFSVGGIANAQTGYYVNNRSVVSAAADYNQFHSAGGAIAFYAGNSNDASNYYYNTIHAFGAIDGTKFAYLSSSGLNIGASGLAVNKLDVEGSAAFGTYARTAAPSNGLIVSGNVGIGTSTPRWKFTVEDSNVTTGAANNASPGGFGNFALMTNTSQAEGVGGELAFGGQDGTAYSRLFAGIKGAKENATSGNYNGYLGLYTTNNGVSMAERMRITSSGNVGIGTTTPASLLNVYAGASGGTTYGSSKLTVEANGTAAISILNSNAGPSGLVFGTASSNVSGGIWYNSAGGTTGLDFRVSTNTTKMVIRSGGEVGIGTTTPNNLLSLYSSTKSALEFSGGATRGAFTMGFDVSNNRFSIASSTALGTTDRFVIDSSGNVGIGTTTPQTNLVIGDGGQYGVQLGGGAKGLYINPNASFVESTIETSSGEEVGFTAAGGVTYAGSWSNHPFRLRTYNTDRLTIDTSGNVGIGDTTPSYKLEVAGDISIGTTDVLRQGTVTAFHASSTAQSLFVGLSAGANLVSSSASANRNTALGQQALSNATSSQYYNTAVGAFAGLGISGATGQGSYNTAIGDTTLYGNGSATMTGQENTALGYSSLFANTTGNSNTGLGAYSLRSNTTGLGNVAAGYQSAYLNTTGQLNATFGYHSGLNNGNGSHNTLLGSYAGFTSTSTSYTTAVGYQALYNQRNISATVDGSAQPFNTGLGSFALNQTTYGIGNTGVGYSAGYSNTTGGSNTAVGFQSLHNSTTGSNNVALGYQSGYFNSTGGTNVYIGVLAGQYNGAGSAGDAVTGSGNITIGSSGNMVVDKSASNQLNIGNLIFGNTLTTAATLSSGGIGIGTTTITSKLSVAGNVGVSTYYGFTLQGAHAGAVPHLYHETSNYLAVVGGSAGIIFRDQAADDNFQFTNAGAMVASDKLTSSATGNYLCINTTSWEVTRGNGSTCTTSDLRAKQNVTDLSELSGLAAIEQLRPVSFNWLSPTEATSTQLGFIAQEVMDTFPSLVNDNGTTVFMNPDGSTTTVEHALSINYNGFIAPMVKAIQEIASISGVFQDRLVAWFANTANGIGSFFARRGHFADQLCVGETCVTPAQFEAMVAAANQPTSGGSPSPQGGAEEGEPDTEAPVITLTGNNPAEISVGDTYTDPGASVTDNVDTNLDIEARVGDNGTWGTIENITLDTSTSTSYTIHFRATDTAGNTGSAERVVNIQ